MPDGAGGVVVLLEVLEAEAEAGEAVALGAPVDPGVREVGVAVVALGAPRVDTGVQEAGTAVVVHGVRMVHMVPGVRMVTTVTDPLVIIGT